MGGRISGGLRGTNRFGVCRYVGERIRAFWIALVPKVIEHRLYEASSLTRRDPRDGSTKVRRHIDCKV